MIRQGIIGAALLAVAGCSPTGDDATADAPVDKTPNAYLGVQTALLEGDLVNFKVRMTGVDDRGEIDDYAECAAAQYALIRGFGFARFVRSTYANEGKVVIADAVYVISAGLPAGSRTIDAEVTVGACGVAGIPTV